MYEGVSRRYGGLEAGNLKKHALRMEFFSIARETEEPTATLILGGT
jgi:hypothetical protein